MPYCKRMEEIRQATGLTDAKVINVNARFGREKALDLLLTIFDRETVEFVTEQAYRVAKADPEATAEERADLAWIASEASQ